MGISYRGGESHTSSWGRQHMLGTVVLAIETNQETCDGLRLCMVLGRMCTELPLTRWSG